MYPPAVPTATKLDGFVASPTHYDSTTEQHTRGLDAHPQRSFPIRTVRSHVAASLSPYAPVSEHHLRRKTPSGTINAGYDGSPSQPLHGPPPPKQIALPVVPGTESRNAYGSFVRHPNHGFGPYPSFVPPGLYRQDSDGLHTASWLPYDAPSTPQSLVPHGVNNPSLVYLTQHPHPQPPVSQVSECNVRAFCPPPLPVNESLPFHQMAWWEDPTFRSNSTQSYYHNWNNGPAVTQVVGAPRLSHIQPRIGDTVPTSSRQARDGQYGYAQDTTSISDDRLRAPNNAGHLHFREKVLARAHRSYVDLLAFFHAARRLQHGKGFPVNAPSSKLLVYPKPPKPNYPLSFVSDEDLMGHDRPSDFDHDASFPHRVGPLSPTNGYVMHSSPTPHMQQHGRSYGCRDGLIDQDDTGPVSKMRSAQGQSPESFEKPGLFGKHMVVANARGSLDILSNLCEQSGWKWTEGLLLGGCLHYGLEQYEEALKWFSRVTVMDSSHVEAITNIAAALFCLDRQDEAEQHWLRAIKLRPDYLEAAEHLVGLLYKKRSKEAIQVIDYIQNALRLNSMSSPQAYSATPSSTAIIDPAASTSLAQSARVSINISQSSQPGHVGSADGRICPGFGSSGYALPGHENGRILALIHAKGTMLYGLKDIAKASRAFEEAVLISAGWRKSGIQDLVRRIQAVLVPTEAQSGSWPHGFHPGRPLLLPPEKARFTAQLVFPRTGELPGLAHVVDGAPKRAAIQTTSNSLLSLAKIFQDTMSSGITEPGCVRQPVGVGDILALYYLSLSLQESPSTANNVGILLAGVQQAAVNASTAWDQAYHPSIPGIPPGSGLALALSYYHYGLRLDPKHVHLYTNLGSLLKDIGQLDLAIQMYERAVSCDGNFDIALTNLANAVKDRGRINDAIHYYKRAVQANPDFAEAVCGLLTALNSVCDWRGRGGVLLNDIQYDQWHVNAEGMLLDARSLSSGSGLVDRVSKIVGYQLQESSHWGRHVLQEHLRRVLSQGLRAFCNNDAHDLESSLSKWAGQPWEGSRLIRLLERAARVMQHRWYCDKYLHGMETSNSRYRRPSVPSGLTIPPAPTVLPFHTFTSPLASNHIRAISQRNAIRISCSTLRSPWLPATVYAPPPPPRPHLNVGYVSSDFNNHPLAHLMQSVFGFHNPKRARAFCYATSASDKSSHRLKIEREAPVFRDVSSWSAERLVEQIVSDEIHILVNLNGYTRGARNEIFAARPSPIQMAFMGFAGSLGAEWCDYILADTMAIPPSTLRPWRSNSSIEDVFEDNSEEADGDWMYSENIIFCRDTFFCCDHAQSCNADERHMTWADEEQRRWRMRKQLFPSLSDDTIILGNFNQLYKIEPTTFRTWLRILSRVPRAVLWLLRFPELGEAHLRRTAESWAGPDVASRLMFTDVAPKNQHIFRARVCDLFLDTPECNAHTTAADVLWSSTPLLTLPRYPYKMCSRMAASILKGALPKTVEGQQAATELIAENEAQYERLAIQLGSGLVYDIDEQGYGQGRGRLAELRRLLWENKWQCGLFNTRRWVDDLEAAYEEAWKRWVAGQGGDIYL
ncbi:hypothetical protein S7711_08724 [Stachybotrys chartarum IBT 7711]|uniref:protein O-GlcNAc transferase n=1 Tax=Stachybotrys chartarum (strain CBS 109288 / IBT 7711) TaxID=1280523 RepID=A0A084AKF7_STACB|nr:hypothetical protein S7711_08724 [Stachybotrys chartarum IBT 7711]